MLGNLVAKPNGWRINDASNSDRFFSADNLDPGQFAAIGGIWFGFTWCPATDMKSVGL